MGRGHKVDSLEVSMAVIKPSTAIRKLGSITVQVKAARTVKLWGIKYLACA